MHLEVTAKSSTPLVLLVLCVIACILWWRYRRNSDHAEIRQEARRWKARVLSIESLPGHTLNEHESCYRVTLQPASGARITAVCRCSFSTPLVWEGTPWWAHPQTPPSPGSIPGPAAHPPPAPAADSFHTLLASYATPPPAATNTPTPAPNSRAQGT